MKTKHIILMIAVMFAVGFFIGRSTFKVKERIEYIKGDPIYSEFPVHLLTPKREIKGNLVDLPSFYFITDTIISNDTVIIKTKADTVRVFDDFMTKKEYDFTMFDNENGRFDFVGNVQFNALQKAGYRFTPIQKVITREKTPTFQPFATAAYQDSGGGFGAGGGVFVKNIGFQYLKFQNKSNMFGLSVKF